LVICVFGLGQALPSLSATAQQEKPKRVVSLADAQWTVDLRQFGYQEADLQKAQLELFHTDEMFLDEHQLVATFVAFEPQTELLHRNNPRRIPPFRLHAVVFDPSSGQLLRQFEWASEFEAIGLFKRQAGGFVIFSGYELTFYRADFTVEKNLTLADQQGPDDVLWFSASPSGKTMLIQYGHEDAADCIWIRDEAIAFPRAKCRVPIGAVISDGEAAAMTDKHSLKVSIAAFQGPVRSLCSGTATCRNPEFVADDRVLLWGGNSIRLADNEGKTIFGGERGLAGNAAYVHAYSSVSRLFVFPSFESGDETFPSAVVYDVPASRQIFEVKNNGKEKIVNLQGLAFSPSGRDLAIEGDGVLRCYSLKP